MLLIHIPRLTNRLGYTMDVLFRHVLRVEYGLTTDAAHFLAHEGPKFSYGPQRLADELHLKSTGLLFETSIRDQEPRPFQAEERWRLFPVFGRDADLGFDPMAAIFYMVSRYEEYLPHHRDEHGRFPAAESLAHRHGFLDHPVVDQWAIEVRNLLAARFPAMSWPKRSYSFVQTVDIDAAWAYRHKGLPRTLAGMGRDLLLRHDPAAVADRLRVLLGQRPDPFDTFDFILAHHRQQQADTHLIFFALMADYDQFDKPISYLNPHFRELLLHLDDLAYLGIHAGYNTLEQPANTEAEAARLADIVHRQIVRSRFHYLRLSLPTSYHILLHAGITHDYTMGFPDATGFRAGTSHPFPFFDLGRNAETPLTIHPFCAMDTALRLRLGLDADQAVERYRTLVSRVRQVDGTFCCVVHHQHLADQPGWHGWRSAYEQMINIAQP